MKNQIEETAELFKALSHPTRLAIVCGLVGSDECNVSKIVENLGLLQPNISQHLSILKNAGIIEGYRKGAQVCYKVTDENIKKLIKNMGLESLPKQG